MFKKQKHNQNPYQENFKNKPLKKGFRDYGNLKRHIIKDFEIKSGEDDMPILEFEIPEPRKYEPTFSDLSMNSIWEKEMIRRLLQEQQNFNPQEISNILSGYKHVNDCICSECLTKPNNKLNEKN